MTAGGRRCTLRGSSRKGNDVAESEEAATLGDVLHQIVDALQTPTEDAKADLHQKIAEAVGEDDTDTSDLTKEELQERADELGVSRSGTKAEIAERIAEAEAAG